VFTLLTCERHVSSIMQIYAVSITIRIVVSDFATSVFIFYLSCHFRSWLFDGSNNIF